MSDLIHKVIFSLFGESVIPAPRTSQPSRAIDDKQVPSWFLPRALRRSLKGEPCRATHQQQRRAEKNAAHAARTKAAKQRKLEMRRSFLFNYDL